MRVAIVGNSNSGKTTLYNALTKSNEKTGNWHGVTVETRSKALYADSSVEIFDLSGLESLSTYSIEEERSKDFLQKGDYDLILNVIEISNIKNALKLTKELASLNKPMLIFFNFCNEFYKSGGKIDINLLKKSISQYVIFGDAIDDKSVKDVIFAIKNKRFDKIKIDQENAIKAVEIKKLKLSKIDKILLNPKTAIFLYLAMVLAIFYLAFGRAGIGGICAKIIDYGIGFLQSFIGNIFERFSVNEFLSNLVLDGIISAVGSVLVFIPQIAVLQFFLIWLEQSGVIARISFLTDSFLSKIGLNGRAMFTILMGFGCSAISVKLSSGAENNSIKKRTAKALPFILCSAKVPVIVYFLNLIFGKFTYLALFFCYLVSVLFCTIYLWIDKKLKSKNSVPMLLLVPPLRKITLKKCAKPLKKSLKEFIIKLGTVVTLVSITVYLLKSVSVNFEYLTESEIDKSILAFLGKQIKFLFLPISVNSWELSTSLLAGVFAKESIISTLSLLTKSGVGLNLPQTISIIIFITFYTPCVVALESYRIEFGLKFALKIAIFQFSIALALCYLTYFLLISFAFKIVVLIAIFTLFIYKVLYEKIRRKKRRKTFKNATFRIRG